MSDIIDVDVIPDSPGEPPSDEDIEVPAFLRKELEEERQRVLETKGRVVYLEVRLQETPEDLDALARITATPTLATRHYQEPKCIPYFT